MTLRLIIILYLILHILLCILVYVGIRTRVLKFSEQLFPIIAMVPVAGMAAAVAAEIMSRFRKGGKKEMSLEELHMAEDVRLQRLEESEGDSMVVPLEEALSVNDAKTRRQLMLEILHQNPGAYVELLQQARMDDDIEVTHYASTAMMELQRDFEINLQRAEQEYEKQPDQPEKLDRCLYCLRKYIDSGLIEESILFVYRTRYAELLQKKLEQEPENMQACQYAVDNYLGLSNYREAKFLADRMQNRWPDREESWLSTLKVCQQMNDAEGIRRVLRKVKRGNVYLSPAGREAIAFWDTEERGKNHE
ncbi:MAG TPA: hypothetical protein H9668_03325 [Firmicutes bacterium]|nr:hypothetical protein [Bacillota bacterium]